MDALERRYKVRAKKKYQKELEKSQKTIIWNIIVLGLNAIAVCINPIHLAILPKLLIDLVSNIRSKTVLEVNIETITEQLEKNNQESVGKRR